MSSITRRRGRWRVQYREDGRAQERLFQSRRLAEFFAASLGPSRPYSKRADIVEEVEFMIRSGQGIAAVARAYGLKEESVERACYRAGRHDLVRLNKSGGAR